MTLHNDKVSNPKDITIINTDTYAPNIRASKYIKKILTNIKGEIDSKTIILQKFNTSVTSMDRSFRQKFNKEILALKDTLYQMDLIDTDTTFHPKEAEYTFFSSTWNILQDKSHDRPQKMSQ